MGEWKLLLWLGYGVTGVSILDSLFSKDIFDGMPIAFRYSIDFFSCIFLLFQTLRAYEIYRSKRIENNRKEFELNVEKGLYTKKIR